MSDVAILLFAAGASARMGGRDKLMEEIGGEPLLCRSARRAVATGLPVTVLLPPDRPDRPDRTAALEGLALATVRVDRAAEGMSRSIRAGLASLPPETAGAMMLQADMPDLETADLVTLADRFRALGADTVTRAAAADGTPGAPAIVPRRLFPALAALEGDTGGRDVLRTEKQELVPLPGRHALTDLDTPEDWAAWRRAAD
ncbi:nucleotidyltransferase family protein [Psychromarinibacter sp. C21-152]|uniref:Nucleotidyltransferase family protein n=1 Tax=Psychromarinibacter sediminicola TaxID=3033385 RepID=A0AAE3NQF0_9RHOB|nr:nucleotidyltransferase family protein [Psychromarinibacter sediminicola]MDF0600516.1 nucleotidyltransferase family protein [Psychromarinibacter sediminicola]